MLRFAEIAALGGLALALTLSACATHQVNIAITDISIVNARDRQERSQFGTKVSDLYSQLELDDRLRQLLRVEMTASEDLRLLSQKLGLYSNGLEVNLCDGRGDQSGAGIFGVIDALGTDILKIPSSHQIGSEKDNRTYYILIPVYRTPTKGVGNDKSGYNLLSNPSDLCIKLKSNNPYNNAELQTNEVRIPKDTIVNLVRRR